jgi:isopenicillin N synthase-like dioxygenase
MSGVPIIDIAPWSAGQGPARAAVASAIDEACRNWGFFIVSGHGIEGELMDRMVEVTRAFFDLPLETRLQVEGRDAPRGYLRFASGASARTRGQQMPPDLRESFRAGPEATPDDPYYTLDGVSRFFMPNVWPDQPAAMRNVWQRYYTAMEDLAGRLMQIFAEALGLPRMWFADKIDRAISQLVAQHYPAPEVPALPGQLRNGEHSDFGSITLLMAENRPGGLQVLGKDGIWHDIIPVPGTFIVNLGDMLERWTNDRWRSTLHRVVNPPREAGSESRRLSVAFFHQPNVEAVIDCIPSCITSEHPKKYEPVTSGIYFANKLATGLNLAPAVDTA